MISSCTWKIISQFSVLVVLSVESKLLNLSKSSVLFWCLATASNYFSVKFGLLCLQSAQIRGCWYSNMMQNNSTLHVALWNLLKCAVCNGVSWSWNLLKCAVCNGVLWSCTMLCLSFCFCVGTWSPLDLQIWLLPLMERRTRLTLCQTCRHARNSMQNTKSKKFSEGVQEFVGQLSLWIALLLMSVFSGSRTFPLRLMKKLLK